MVKPTRDELYKLYVEQGQTGHRIAATYGVCYVTVYKWLRQHGISVRPRGRHVHQRKYSVNANFFDRWSPQSAWLLGLMMADSAISEKGFAHAVAARDVDLLHTMSSFLDTDSPVRKEIQHRGGIGYRLRVYSIAFVASLSRFGIVSRKCTILKYPPVPLEYSAHLVRGLHDGDGSLFITQNGYWTWTLACKAKRLMCGVARTIKTAVDVTIPCRLGYGGLWTVRTMARDKVSAILHWLYDAGGPAGKRKRALAVKAMRAIDKP